MVRQDAHAFFSTKLTEYLLCAVHSNKHRECTTIPMPLSWSLAHEQMNLKHMGADRDRNCILQKRGWDLGWVST